MRTTWVLLADEARARFLELPDDGGDLREVDQMTHASSQADIADLRRDAHGRRGHNDLRMGGNATASAGEDELHREADLFARRVAERLSQAQQSQRYAELRVAAAPRFLGHLRQVPAPARWPTRWSRRSTRTCCRKTCARVTRRLFPTRGRAP